MVTSYYSEPNENFQKETFDLHVLPYVMDALRDKRIRPRQVVLLAMVDRFRNPFLFRCPDDRREPVEPKKFALFTIDQLCHYLHCKRDAVRILVKDLEKKKLLRARKRDRHVWQLKTRLWPKKENEPGVNTKLKIHAEDWQHFMNGTINGRQLLVMSRNRSFWWPGNDDPDCWMSNRNMGKETGVGGWTVSTAMSRLEACNLLKLEYTVKVSRGGNRFLTTRHALPPDPVPEEPEGVEDEADDRLPDEEPGLATPDEGISSFDVEMGQRLYNLVEDTTISSAPLAVNFVRYDGASEAEIERAIEWFEEHRGEGYCSTLRHANDFHTKFSRIAAAMRRDEDLVRELM